MMLFLIIFSFYSMFSPLILLAAKAAAGYGRPDALHSGQPTAAIPVFPAPLAFLFIKKVDFAQQKTEGVYFFKKYTPPVTAFAVPAPSKRGSQGGQGQCKFNGLYSGY